MRVYEYARKIGVESSDVVAEAKAIGIDATSASSGLTADEVKQLDLSFAENGHTGPKTGPEPNEPPKADPEESLAPGQSQPEEKPEPKPKQKKRRKKKSKPAGDAETGGKRSGNHPALNLP